MNQYARIFLSLFITGVIIVTITLFVMSRVRRASSVSTRKATEAGVLFIVNFRRWQSRLISGAGILFMIIGLILLPIGILAKSGSTSQGASIGGVIIAIIGVLFVWIAQALARIRLEVSSDSIWVFGWIGAPRQVFVRDIAQLRAMISNNYGGIVAQPNTGKLFAANRLMLGYPQLIEYLRTSRPDLPIPDESLPLQSA